MYPRIIQDIYHGKYPNASYFGHAIETMMIEGYDQRLYQLLSRLSYLGIRDKDKLYRLCFQKSLQFGRKDLAEYFLLYVDDPYDEIQSLLKKKGHFFYNSNRDIPLYLFEIVSEDKYRSDDILVEIDSREDNDVKEKI